MRQLQDVKARLSEVIKHAHEQGHQEVTVRGKPSAVVVSIEYYHAIQIKRPPFVECWAHPHLLVKILVLSVLIH